MPTPVVRELAADLLSDWLAFFDHDAFADHPEWANCYCHFFHANHAEKDWDARSAEENRAASSALILSGRLRGHLAYLDGKPAGWCQAAPRLLIPNIASDPDLAVNDAGDVGSIACFAVARLYRGLGLARYLLDAACAGFRAQGLRIAEAYPRVQAEGDAANYHGPLSLYLNMGFSPHLELEKVVVVRRDLTATTPGQ
jgi:GNAT superfamily N-acetyltransferase